MNKTYRLVRNARTGLWTAVSECCRSCGKAAAGPALVTAAALLTGVAGAQTPPAPGALPTGGQVVGGQAQIQQSGASMTIQQGSQRAAIDWQSFNVGSQAQVHFQQPSTQSVTLNRVVGAEASQIFGRITANGQVFLSNPSGVYFAPGASVDVGGLVATTHRISLDDFMAGRTRFERQGATGSVVNEGELRAALGGYIALLAPEVRNQGIVIANLGTVALAAGEVFELQFDANHTLAGLRVEPSTIKALVDNRSAVLAPGGLVILSAQALDRVQGGVIRNSGRIEATGLAQRGGRIVLEASSQVANSGSISASATAQGPAGSVRLLAPEVANSGSVTATGHAAHAQGGSIDIVAGTVVQAPTGHLDASAPQQGGTVRLQASGVVELAGTVSAAATASPAPAPAPASAAPAQGGQIEVSAAQLTLASAVLDVSGEAGGHIVLDASTRPASHPTQEPAPQPSPQPAPEPGKVALLGNTQFNARGRRGAGGDLTVLGDHIGLNDQTVLDATGSTGGGTVRVGGGWQGAAGWYQATTVTMAEGARIDASATQQGDGGTVVLWSDIRRADSLTTAAGSIRARGGAQGGNGGRIETSGHAVALEGLAVDAGAAAGRGGTGGLWLIDPTDSVITQTIANGYAATLDTGTSVLNEVTGNITWNSGVTLNTTAGGAGNRAALTLRSSSNTATSHITLNNASINATEGALDLVLWSSYNTGGYEGRVRITGSTINTKGGHVWVGGGDAAGALWNGLAVGTGGARTWLADTQGVYVQGSTINTGAGSIRMAGVSHVTGGNLSGTSNMGVWLDTGTTLLTTTGNISIEGNLLGSYSQATGLRIGAHLGSSAGNVRIESGAGSISLTGTLQGTPGSWGHGLFFDGNYIAGNQVTVRSGSGDITVTGSATPTGGSGDVSGLQFHGGSSGGFTRIVSSSGNITLRGNHSNTAAWYSNGIRFSATNTANSIRIGDDGSGSYSGNILIESDSLFQRDNNAGAASIAVQSSGALTFQSAGASFTALRAGNDGGNIALTFDDDWNFGTALSSFTLGKSTNTANLTLSNALSVAGGINLYGGQLTLSAALTSTATGDINLIGNAATNAGIFTNGSGSISKTGGGDSTLTVRSNGRVNLGPAITNTSTSGVLNVVLWSDYGNATNYGVSGVPTITTRGGHLWIGGSSSVNGSTTWNGLTVGDGAAAGGAGNVNTIDLAGAISTANGAAGGDVYLWGGTSTSGGGVSLNGFAGFTGITAGSGNITLRGNTFNWPAAVNISSTGAFTLWSGAGTIGTDTGSFGQATDFAFFRFNTTLGGLTWGGAGNTQTVTYSPTQNASLSMAGPIRVVGGDITLNASLGSTLAGAGISLLAAGSIATSNAITLSTNGGALLLASDTDNVGGGNIRLGGNFTANTNGGSITLGGGLDGSGYAQGFGTGTFNATGIRFRGTTSLNSGGGNISLRGRSHTAGGNGDHAASGLWFDGSTSIDSGTGTVYLEGVSQASASSSDLTPGVMFSYLGGATTTTITSANTTADAIRLVGSAATAGNASFNSGLRFYSNGTRITATGLGGGITLEGTRNTAGNANDILFANSSGTGTTSSILANGGAINLIGRTANGQISLGSMTLGSQAATAVTSSSSNITLTADGLSNVLAGSAVNTSGTLTVQPFGNNFSSTLNWPVANLTLAGTVSGLTLGKDVPGVAKTDTININAPQTIAGSISVYGGAVNVNAALTAAGDITLVSSGATADLLINVPITSTATGPSSLLLKSARNVSLAAGGSITAGSGALNTQFWADSDRTGDGIVRLLSNIDTNGGWLRFGNNEFATINGVSTRVGGDVFINGSVAQTIRTRGGQFDLFGEAILANTAGLTIDSGGGNVNFYGVLNSGNTYTFVDKTGSAGSGSWTAARTEARNGTAGGAAVGDSYLATIGSRLENALVSLAAGYRGAWIGAWRAAPTTSYAWTWADGPDAGQNFFNQNSSGGSGSAVAGRYHNFGAVEPNGTLAGNESVGQLFGTAGQWNDLSPTTTYSASQLTEYSVLGFVRETNLANSPLTINAGTGAVTIQGGVGGSKALASLNVQAASTTINGSTLITSGAQSYNNALTVNSSGDLNVGATAITVSNANQGALFKAAGNITVNTGVDITTNNGDLQFWSNAGNAGTAGSLVFGGSNTLNTANGSTTQATGGGRIVMAGGLDDGSNGGTAGDGIADGFASSSTTAGISLGPAGAGATTTALYSGGGDIVLRGRSTLAGGTGVTQNQVGIFNAGHGTVSITGTSTGGHGVELGAYTGGSTTITAGGGDATHAAITISGTSTAASNYAGLQTNGGSMQATGAGGIRITGTGSSGNYSANNLGMDALAASGPIDITAVGSTGLRYLGTLGRKAATGVTASSSNVTLTADALTVNTGITVDTTGTLTVQPYGSSFSSPLNWPISNLNLAPGVGGLTLGKAGNTADITLASALTVNGPVALYGGNLTLNAGLTATGSTVTLAASGAVSDGASGFVSAAGLRLLGGNVTLDNAGHSIGTLAASGVGSLTLRSSGTLAIGSIGGTSGVAASGAVDISTESGDLALDASVATSATGNNAIVLNAGRAAAAGTATGGNIVVSGSPAITTGAGGRATLYSGAVAGGTGLGTLVGTGSGRFRYHSDEVASNFSTALGSGVYAIYREQPTVALAWGSQSVVYGTAPSAFGYTVTSGTLYNGDTPTAAVSGGVLSGAGQLAVSASPYAVTGTGALAALGYGVSQTNGQVTVTPRTLTASYGTTSRAYDGTLAATVAGTSDDRLAGDVFNVSGTGVFADKNAGTGIAITVSGGSLAGADAANYVLAAGGSTTGTITPRTVTVGGAVVAGKVYDGTTDATLTDMGQVLTGVGAETLVLTATDAAFDNANAGTGKTVTVSGYALANGTNGGLASNYALASTTATTTADITKAVLTVVANNDAKFITLADNTAYNGVSYTGFVNGETSTVVGGAASITRSNVGVEGAGTYTGVLVADTSGLTSANYSFQAVNGSYTIVPADQLLVRVANTTGTYGSTTTHSVTSAQYFDGSNVIDLPGITANGGNRFTIADGVGGSATLTLTPTGATTSTGGRTGAGVWQLGATDVSTLNANNFSDTITVVGSQTVNRQGVSVNPGGGVSKVYDGSTAMTGLNLQLTGALVNDVLTVGGAGAFADRNAGSNIDYTVSGITLAGADAANYYLTGGTSFSGNNGSITPRVLVVGYTGVDKVYDGNTTANVTTTDNRVAGDAFSIGWAAQFADKNVGTGKTIAVSGVGLSGTHAGNYTVDTTGAATADITRLGSVTWVGGNTGNWFDPANWAGGAVPDLANVANVVIPNGVTVTFDTAGVVLPAQTGPVLIDSLGGAGGGLVQNDGSLNVGGGGVTLDNLQQSGGSLSSDGSIVLNSFAQTGGSTGTQGNLTVTGDFSQGSGGTVNVQGNVSITDTAGGVTLGNLTAGGNLDVTSSDGDITQASGTAVTVGGTTTVDAGANDVVLDSAGNDFQGPFNGSGQDITVVDGAGGLVLGTINATGNLNATSTAGDITQVPGSQIAVGGTGALDAPGHSVLLAAAGNVFVGGLLVNGVPATAGGAAAGGVGQTLPPVLPPPVLPTPTTAPPVLDESAPLTQAAATLPGITSTSTATQDNSGITVRVLREPAGQQEGQISVLVPRQLVSAGFSFPLPAQVTAGAAPDAAIVVTLESGAPLPAWLRFDRVSRRFVAQAVPAGGLPLRLVVSVDGRRSVLVLDGE